MLVILSIFLLGEAKMVCQLKDERNTQTESLSCLAVEWPEAVYL